MGTLIDLTGKRFGLLKVEGRADQNAKSSGASLWACRCRCGKATVVDGRDLRRGATRSCGKSGCVGPPRTAREQLAEAKRLLERPLKPKHDNKHEGVDRRKLVKRDLTGRTFGRLRVKRFSHRDRYNKDLWVCVCKCGRTRIVRGTALLAGRNISCGSRYCKLQG